MRTAQCHIEILPGQLQWSLIAKDPSVRFALADFCVNPSEARSKVQ